MLKNQFSYNNFSQNKPFHNALTKQLIIFYDFIGNK